MATRIRIAAAACMVASGLFVAGAGAALAIAEPDTGHDGTFGGAPVDSTGTLSAPSTSARAPADTTTSAGDPVPTATVTAPKPTSEVGDGRNGLTPDRSADASGVGSSSKQSALDSKASSQTDPARTGEPTSTVSARIGEEDPSSSPTDTTTDTTTNTTTKSTTTTTTTTAGPGPPPGDDPPPKDDHPGTYPGWHWWPWCWSSPPGPGLPPGSGSPPVSGGNGAGGVSIGTPPIAVGVQKPPPMQLPASPVPAVVPPTLPVISVDPAVDAITGLATAAANLPFTPVTLPVIVPPVGVGPGSAGGAGGAPRPGAPAAPRTSGSGQGKNQPPKAQQPNPSTFGASNGALPATYRAGYGEYLRTAGVSQIAAVAVPGVTGILVLTGAGGLLGYRQARAGLAVRTNGTARFMG